MSVDRVFKPNQAVALDDQAQAAHFYIANTSSGNTPLLPLGALLLAGSLGSPALAQPATGDAAGTLPAVTVRDSAASDGATHSKTQLRATRTEIGKGDQALRDIPQSVTVMTEKLMSDRNLDDFREVLRTTAGVSFQAGETGEEDVRLRGFSLGTAGDIYRDGLRDAPLIERDTFNDDRVEIIKGSASMLFGKGSTGGVVNQVSKQPFLMTQHEASATLGNGNEKRVQGDFNWQTGPDAALRLNLMAHDADNWGARQRKLGIAPTVRWGIGTRDEFSVGFYHLQVDGRANYNHPWFIRDGRIVPTLPARNFYGLDSDKQNSTSTYLTLGHTHRFDDGGQLKTQLRHGRYERDLWASAIRFGTTGGAPTTLDNWGPSTFLIRTPKGRIGQSNLTQLQSDYSNTFRWGGREHKLIAGVDLYVDDARRNNNFAGPASGLNTTVGTPHNGDWRADTRGDPVYNTFNARNLGLYVQDTVAMTDALKLVAGLRLDHFKARYDTAASTAANGVVTPGYRFDKSESLWSPRVGLLFQPSETQSYYVSYGTSYNTSGDAYQFTPASPGNALANTPAEKSRNLEIGGKWDVFDQRLSLGAALFYSEKYNERNLDPDSAAQQYLLSGKRHAAGVEFNAAGRITPAWELFWNHTFIPSARIDQSNQVLAAGGGGAQVQGDRPGLTPRHSGSLWTTYRVNPKLRLGLGANYRGSQNPEGNRAVKAAGFVTVDVMAEYTLTEMTTLKLNVSNLTDKLYADTLYRGFYGPGQPRRVQLTLKHLF
ncbi:TonB-dependent siderophore receptor [Ottowia sp.]|uniref:TonB-dependent receptor n=1 Tax=Ottowia sp. TaxID=1898956 RepID=UPI002BF23660|nr:TonB-dependent siderophore receptor [Ottowia sp.]HOB66840.1 TonB-dependent siderophore receptor [Ottowia sp.]HPZ55892.1 TonB-dependent siderophore receptor [Ottowia sp.]HQD47994.1 TonB-dependent siderophore receptor [Ottowia sp.]